MFACMFTTTSLSCYNDTEKQRTLPKTDRQTDRLTEGVKKRKTEGPNGEKWSTAHQSLG